MWAEVVTHQSTQIRRVVIVMVLKRVVVVVVVGVGMAVTVYITCTKYKIPYHTLPIGPPRISHKQHVAVGRYCRCIETRNKEKE